MVLEDDVWADDAVLVREIMTEAQRAMVKDWIVLQLGSRNCDSPGFHGGPLRLSDLDAVGLELRRQVKPLCLACD